MNGAEGLSLPIFDHFLMPPPRFEPGTFRLRTGGNTNGPQGLLTITFFTLCIDYKTKWRFHPIVSTMKITFANESFYHINGEHLGPVKRQPVKRSLPETGKGSGRVRQK